jgi:hypothetical protein
MTEARRTQGARDTVMVSGFALGQMMSGPDIMRSADAAMHARQLSTATDAEPQFAGSLGEFYLPNLTAGNSTAGVQACSQNALSAN